MEDSGFEDLRQWIQDQIMFQDSRPEVTSGNTRRSSTGTSQFNPTSPRKIAWNDDSIDSEDRAAHASSAANADPSGETMHALTDEQKEILSHKEEGVRRGEITGTKSNQTQKKISTVTQTESDEDA